MGIAEHIRLFTRLRVADDNSKRYVELRGQAVNALRSVLEAHKNLEDALDVSQVVLDEIDILERRNDPDPEAA